MSDLVHGFIVEWHDTQAAVTRRYRLFYHASDKTVEIFDIEDDSTFLKRSKVENFGLHDLYIGSTVNILSRQLNVVDYGDEYTREKERTLGIIKPDALLKMGLILDEIHKNGFMITQMKMCKLTRDEASEFYQEHQGKPFFDNLLNFVTRGPLIAFELMREGCVSKWRDLSGPTDSAVARQENPQSIRAMFGKDTTENACHGSDSIASAVRELEFFFPSNDPGRNNIAKFTDFTYCIIKPHAVLAGKAGQILSKILEAGFEISALQMFHMEKANAEEFYEAYKWLVPEYIPLVTELTSGPCIALEIRAQDVPKAFREMVGPADPEIARILRPSTLRAAFGIDKVKNAVHCTDLPEDGLLERDKYSFIVEWYDAHSALRRRYQLYYYARDGTVEMFDIKDRREVLKRSKVDSIGLHNLYIGSTVNIQQHISGLDSSMQLNFVDYGDEYTKKRERTLGIIKPDALLKMGLILDEIHKNGLIITQMKMCKLTRDEALEFYQEHQGKPFFDNLLDFVTRGPLITFELMGEGCVSKWRDLLGPTDSVVARNENPQSIRAMFGKDATENVCHGSDSIASAVRELGFFFPSNGPGRNNTAKFIDCTCCIIKPHAVLAGKAGQILSKILQLRFEISALQMFHMKQANAEEFYQVYKGVVPVKEYTSMVAELTSGPCIALEIRAEEIGAEDAVKAFREKVGPADPEIARHLRPNTLRAAFGINKEKNAVHCTELPEHGIEETEYFFRILDRS